MMDEMNDLGDGPFWKVMTLDGLTRICGYFNNETPVNNHYGCDHPDCDDTELDEDAGKQQGRCMPWACPFGTSLNPDETEDKIYYEKVLGGKPEDFIGGEDYMIVRKDPRTKNNLR